MQLVRQREAVDAESVPGVFARLRRLRPGGGRPHRGDGEAFDAADAGVGGGVDVDRKEEVGLPLAGDLGALRERKIDIALAGQRDAVSVVGEFFRDAPRHLQRQVFFARGLSGGAVVVAAVAGVDHDVEDPVARHRTRVQQRLQQVPAVEIAQVIGVLAAHHRKRQVVFDAVDRKFVLVGLEGERPLAVGEDEPLRRGGGAELVLRGDGRGVGVALILHLDRGGGGAKGQQGQHHARPRPSAAVHFSSFCRA